MLTVRYVLCDVFTDTPLEGNQLAVFTDARGLDEAAMQGLALELGFSESVFVFPAEAGGHASIRIFTPRYELPFAGHPTLGTAFVLAAPMQLGVIELETGSGVVPVVLERDESGRIVFGRMQQPVPSVQPVPDADELLSAIGVERSELPVELYDNGAKQIFVALSSEDGCRGIGARPNGARAVGGDGDQLLRGHGLAVEDEDVLAVARDRRGRRDRQRGRAAGLPSRTAWLDRVGRRDRDLAGRRDRAAVEAVRRGRRRRRADRPRRGRRFGGRRRTG